ncbi:LolA-like outer membrane lipoprotein chaperone [bacterium]|nr:LolA-like outer membrane lipoprotein chaperone [bacterium]MBU1959080.1 LolA-like outer membrane lipoprotein chaperone [bacterium]
MKSFITLSALVVSLNASIILPDNFKTNFKQTITNDKGKVIKYEGDVLFKNMKQNMQNPTGEVESYSRSLFKWNYSSPTKKEVCTDGIQVIIVDHDLEQVSRYLVDEGINLEEILKVAQKITNKDYKATYKETEYIISLDENKQLSKIIYVDNLDNGVKIIFDNMNYNTASFNETDLACQAPKEYDIIEG